LTERVILSALLEGLADFRENAIEFLVKLAPLLKRIVLGLALLLECLTERSLPSRKRRPIEYLRLMTEVFLLGLRLFEVAEKFGHLRLDMLDHLREVAKVNVGLIQCF
jgi:hypothetical protein